MPTVLTGSSTLTYLIPCSSSSDGGGYRGYFGMGMEDLDNKDGTRDLAMEEGNCGSSDKIIEAEGTNR